MSDDSLISLSATTNFPPAGSPAGGSALLYDGADLLPRNGVPDNHPLAEVASIPTRNDVRSIGAFQRLLKLQDGIDGTLDFFLFGIARIEAKGFLRQSVPDHKQQFRMNQLLSSIAVALMSKGSRAPSESS